MKCISKCLKLASSRIQIISVMQYVDEHKRLQDTKRTISVNISLEKS